MLRLQEDGVAVPIRAMFAKLSTCDGFSCQAKDLFIPKALFMKFCFCCVRVGFCVENGQQIVIHLLLLHCLAAPDAQILALRLL